VCKNRSKILNRLWKNEKIKITLGGGIFFDSGCRYECWCWGLLYDHGHLSRAVCCRLAHGEPDISAQLPSGFHINHPLLGRVTTYDPPRETQKTKEMSLNWALGDEHVELTDGTKGICVSTYVLLLRCKSLSEVRVLIAHTRWSSWSNTLVLRSLLSWCSWFLILRKLCFRWNFLDNLRSHFHAYDLESLVLAELVRGGRRCCGNEFKTLKETQSVNREDTAIFWVGP